LDVIVLPSPPGGQYSRFVHGREDLAIEQFVSELSVAAVFIHNRQALERPAFTRPVEHEVVGPNVVAMLRP
jgi:hypothetical protein